LEALKLCREHRIVFPVPITFAAAATLLERYDEWEISANLAQLAQTNTASDFQIKRYVQDVLNRLSGHLDPRVPASGRSPGLGYALDTVSREELLYIQQCLIDLPDLDPERPVLTGREQEVLKLLVNGATNRQIALTLHIAEGTVKRYTHHLFAKLSAQNRAEAVYRATEWNLI
jgi:ATP/maltotriose-dependent transcriptional regulator MalT